MMISSLIFKLIMLNIINIPTIGTEPTTRKSIINGIFNIDGYDNSAFPSISYTEAHLVIPRIQINDIFDVSVHESSFKVAYY